MPNNIIKSFAEKSGKSVKEVEKLWNKAKAIAKESDIPETDKDKFYSYVTGILKKMLSIKEATTAANIPDISGPAGFMPGNIPYFNCNDEQFWSLHTKSRQNKQWFNKHYGDSSIGQWCKKNKGKDFYIKHESGMFRKIKAK